MTDENRDCDKNCVPVNSLKTCVEGIKKTFDTVTARHFRLILCAIALSVGVPGIIAADIYSVKTRVGTLETQEVYHIEQLKEQKQVGKDTVKALAALTLAINALQIKLDIIEKEVQ